MFRSRSIAYSLVLSALAASAALAQSPLDGKGRRTDVIAADLQTKGTSRVIVEFAVPASNLRTQSALTARMNAVRSGQDAILNSAFGSVAAATGHALSRMRIKPMFAMSVNAAELDRLARDSRVTRIFHDNISHPDLIQSIPLIGADKLQKDGGTGEGFIVAIIDTGVEHTHDFVGKRIIMGACFSTTDAGDGGVSTCKGGVAEDEGPEAGDSCTTSAECFHGTHVAGIAAGKLTHKADHPGEPRVGVAPKAMIVAINVFSAFGSDLGAYDSDIEKGLEWVFAHRTDFPGLAFASTNMSLGDGTDNATNCDDADPLTGIIEDLRAQNIATAIASGNEARKNGVAAPGCISAAVTVSATTKSDAIPSFANMGDLVDVMAPGFAIRSSVLNNLFGVASGTSMAAPHVAGTFAAERSLHPDASVDDIEKALERTGKDITDTRTGGTWTKPRIQVQKANKKLGS